MPEEWVEEAEKFAEEEYDTFERKYKGEDWWESLKEKWGKGKIKEFLYEYARRCLLHKPPKDYEAYDLREALMASIDYAGPTIELYRHLVEEGLFPLPPEEEIEVEALKEDAKKKYERLQYYLKKLEEEGLIEDLKKTLKTVDYKTLYDEARKKLKKLEETHEEIKRELEETLKKYREAIAERDRMVDEISRRIWREWAKKPEKPKMDYFQLIEIIRIFVDECRRRHIDPNTIKIEEVLSPYLTFEENKRNVLKRLEEYKALPPEEAEKLRRELEEWKRKAEEAERKYAEMRKREEEALKPPKPVLGDREYKVLLKEFIDQVGDKVILSKELMDALQRVFKLEWEVNKIAYLDFREAEDYVRSLAEKWAKTVEGELREYKGIIPKVTAETEKKVALDYEKLAEEVARRMEKYMPKETGYAAPGFIPPKPSQPIPMEPLDPRPFPRRLVSTEYPLFEEHYKRILWEHGLNPFADYYRELFIAFRDAWHDSWEQVLERFNIIVKCALEGLPPPVFAPPEVVFREIPKDPILWTVSRDIARLLDEQCKSFEELAELVKDETKDKVTGDVREKIKRLTAEDVRRVFEEEYAKGENANSRFKKLRWEHPYYLWNIGFRPRELEEKAKSLVFSAIASFPASLEELVEYVKRSHGFKIEVDEAREWIKEELEKPPEKADIIIRKYRDLAEKLLK